MGRENWLLFRAGLAGWSNIVTKFAVLELHGVVSVCRISVDAMVQAGISRTKAEEAYDAAHRIANESKRRIREALRKKGWPEERIQSSLGRDIDW